MLEVAAPFEWPVVGQCRVRRGVGEVMINQSQISAGLQAEE